MWIKRMGLFFQRVRLARQYVLMLLVVLGGLAALRPAWATPDIQHWTTSNGARVYFVQAPELPMVDLRVVFDAGAARDDGKAGLAALTNTLLTEGAGGLNADALADRFEGVGARLGSGSLRDMAWVSLRSLSDPELLDPVVEGLAWVLDKPNFATEDFQRERDRMLVAVREESQLPSSIAEKAFYRAVYGDHPYASPPGGTEESLQAIDLDQVKAFYRRYYVARNAVVAIMGNVDRARAEALAEAVAGSLPAGERAPELPPVPALATAQQIHIDHPSAQTHIFVGQPGMSRTDPDYFALYLANHVLGGGGLVSRLSDEIREKRGLSYSVYSYFLPMERKGPFQIGLQTRGDQAEAALQVVDKTLRDYVVDGPTDGELTASKKNVTGGFPLRIDSNSDIVEYLSVIGFYDLPLDYLDRFVDRINALSLAQVHHAFQERIDPDKMVTVVVGPPAGEKG